MKETMKKLMAVFLIALFALFAFAATGEGFIDLTQPGTVDSFEELQEAAGKAVLVDAPEDAVGVTYRWIEEMNVARIEFDFEGIHYALSACEGEVEGDTSIGGDFGDVSEPVPTDGNISLTLSTVCAEADGYSAQNETSYALMGPSALKGQLTLDMAKQLFPADCD